MTDYFIQVGDYTAGKLTASAKEAFELEMSTNEELKRAVENHDIMDVVLDGLWEDDARRVAEEAQKAVRDQDLNLEISQKKEANVFPIRRMMAVAASFLGLVVAGYFLMQNLDNSNQDLYADFYNEYMGTQSRGSENSDALALCDQGHILMDNQEFKKAIDVFKTSISQNEDCAEKSQWYLMLAYDHEENDEQRNMILETILNNQDHEFYQTASEAKDKLN